jgi:hypothetical protein
LSYGFEEQVFPEESMKLTGISLILLLLSVLLSGAVTLFESALAPLSTGAERLLTFLLLVLPAGTGCVLAVMSLTRRQGRAWLAITLVTPNGL